MLLHVFEIHHINAESKFAQKPIIQTPPLKLFKHNFSELIAQDKSDDLSLKRIADNMRDDKVIFQTLADPILDDLNDVDDDTSLLSWNSLLIMANAAVLFLLILGSCHLYYKIRILATALAVLQQAQYVRSQDVIGPKNDGINIFSTTTMKPSLTPLYVAVHDDTLIYVLVTCASNICLCMFLFHY